MNMEEKEMADLINLEQKKRAGSITRIEPVCGGTDAALTLVTDAVATLVTNGSGTADANTELLTLGTAGGGVFLAVIR